MVRRVCLFAVLTAVLAGFAFQWNVATSAAASLGPCDYVQHFKILERPTQITSDDLMWLDEFPDFGPKTMDGLQAAINKNGGAIKTLQQLLDAAEVGTGKAFLVRIFFNLSGEETCQIDS